MTEEQELVMTKSAKRDHIIEFLKGHKEYREIIYSFKMKPNSTFFFNPLDDKTITDFFVDNPDEFLLILKAAVLQILEGVSAGINLTQHKNHLKMQITDAREIKLQEWGPQHEGIPLATNCQVIGAMQEETYTKYAEAYCRDCGYKENNIRDLGNLPKCTNKECTYYRQPLTLNHKTFKTGSIRTIMIQEPLEDVKHGSPRILSCVIKDDDVFNTYIGQRKRLIGVFRSIPQFRKSTNLISIAAISLQTLEEIETVWPSPEQIKHFKELVKKDNFQQIITDSFSPEIKYGGTELVKLCIILAILGGNKTGRLRDFVHCLMIGDPGTGKTRIMEFITMIIQKSAMAVGGTMSGSGVTVTMDTLPNRQKMPRAGIIPTCTGGVACIDELNQLEEEDQGKLFEGMASGKIHYNKGGHDVTLIAETTIIAGANPRGYIYDKTKSIVDNVNLPAPLISRFDFKINMLDTATEIEERKILEHMDMIQNQGVENYLKKWNLMTSQDLTLFFNYAKTMVPKMTPEAAKIINDFHITMRSIEQPSGSFKLDKRFPESMKRIAIAYAKLHLETKVTPEMAMTVIEIFKSTLKTFGMKTEEGQMQFSFEDARHTKQTAFTFAFREEQQNQEADYILEEPLLVRMVKNYPKLFPTTDKAEAFVEANSNKITKRGGRIRLE